jgi:hypothetical protein
MDSDGFTNRPPFLPPGVTEFSKRPLSDSELQSLQNELDSAKAGKSLPRTRFVIDGLVTDWKDFKTAWSSKRREGFREEGQVFNVTACYYCNDNDYLYFFLRFAPSVKELFAKLNSDGQFRSIGNVGFFYFCGNESGVSSDSVDTTERFVTSSADRVISVMAGTHTSMGKTAAMVAYQVSIWNSLARDFGAALRAQLSTSEPSLINYGTDGVEMAIPLSDIRKSKGDRCDFIFDGPSSSPRQHRFTVAFD